jgi:hypothetical protein
VYVSHKTSRLRVFMNSLSLYELHEGSVASIPSNQCLQLKEFCRLKSVSRLCIVGSLQLVVN